MSALQNLDQKIFAIRLPELFLQRQARVRVREDQRERTERRRIEIVSHGLSTIQMTSLMSEISWMRSEMFPIRVVIRTEAEDDPEMEPRMEPKVATRMEAEDDPGMEPRTGPRAETRMALEMEQEVETRTETRVDPKAAPQTEREVETRMAWEKASG